MRIVFLLEEKSMKNFLDKILPRLFPELLFLCVSHRGKSDLQQKIPQKLNAWNVPNDRFVIVQDKDSSDCRALKNELMELCVQGGRADSLVRIVCQELEAWYIGDLSALEKAYSCKHALTKQHRKRFSDPDSVGSPSRELEKLVPEFQKASGARKMGELMTAEGNSSKSFSVFLAGVKRLVAEGVSAS